MNKIRKSLVLVMAIVLGVSSTSIVMGHKNQKKHKYDNYSDNHHDKKRHRHDHSTPYIFRPHHKKRHRHSHFKPDRYRPHRDYVRYDYFYPPVTFGDGLDIILRYHID